VEPQLADFAAAGADSVTVHVEADSHVHRSLQRARELGLGVGVSLNPGTPLEAVEPLLDVTDLVLVMSVNPGLGGQRFIPQALARVRRLRDMIGHRPVLIQVDGGVTSDNAGDLVSAGADALVAGSAIFNGHTPEAYAANLASIRTAADGASAGRVRDPSGSSTDRSRPAPAPAHQ